MDRVQEKETYWSIGDFRDHLKAIKLFRTVPTHQTVTNWLDKKALDGYYSELSHRYLIKQSSIEAFIDKARKGEL